MPAQENFRINLGATLEHRGISQYTLNKMTGISRAHINKALHGTVEPSLGLCEKIAVSLKIPLAIMILDPRKFKEIAESSLDKINVADILQSEITPESPQPPNVRRGPNNKRKAASRSDGDNRLRLWVRSLMRSAQAG